MKLRVEKELATIEGCDPLGCLPRKRAAACRVLLTAVPLPLSSLNYIIVRPATVYGSGDRLGLSTPRL